MHMQPEQDLLNSYANMTDDDREMLVSFAGACARDNPRQKSVLTLIIGGRRGRLGSLAGDINSQSEDLSPTFNVRSQERIY